MQDICIQQEEFGVCFDSENAVDLYSKLCDRRSVLVSELVDYFGSFYLKDKEFTPKRDNKRMSYKAGCAFTKLKLVEFNPGSRHHIANRLKFKYKWKPKKFTDKGGIVVDETVLSDLKYPEAQLLNEYLLVKKRISQVAEADGAWLRYVENGRIHGHCNPQGTISGRAAHSSPNLGQVVASGSVYGTECRQCFIATPGRVLVGADASGLELRCLAHYMALWDNGEYAREVISGDIHTTNQHAAGLSTRDDAKTFIYALLYGAGDTKLGSITGQGAVAGKKLRTKFMKNIPAYAKLIKKVKEIAKKRGYLTGLDGRQLHIRSAYSALNQLLQGAGAVIMKKATINYHNILKDKGLTHGVDYWQVLWVHDEWQVECSPELADIVGQAMVDGIRKVTQDFDLNCELDGEYKVGNNWAETH